jgi:hypothetical protein
MIATMSVRGDTAFGAVGLGDTGINGEEAPSDAPLFRAITLNKPGP